MRAAIKNIFSSFCFILLLAGFLLANIILPDGEFSYSERRRLAPAPVFSVASLFSGELFEKFEKYTLDQFVWRDTFRGIKAIGSKYLFRQKDNNDIYIIDGNISKMVYPLNEKSIRHAADKINEIYSKYLSGNGNKVCFSVIPDKNYFLAEQNGYLSMDYERLLEILQENLKSMQYINLFDSLSIDDYYRTDIHWRQESLHDIANIILFGMGKNLQRNADRYDIKSLYPFYGSLYGQAAMMVEPDTMFYLTSPELEQCSVYDYELESSIKVYAPEKFEGIDPYDVFLSGAKPLLKITNEEADTGNKLILFRDSFGSSIAPLLLSEYDEITLVDLRYISSDILDRYIDFSGGQDVLFLYNTQILNNSYLLK